MACIDFGLPVPDIDNSVIPSQHANVSEEPEKASKNMELPHEQMAFVTDVIDVVSHGCSAKFA